MSATLQIAVLVGSLRKGSFSRRLARALIDVAPFEAECTIIEIGQLPLYDQDGDDFGRAPVQWLDFRATMRRFDAVLFVTPEYNRSVPAVLKNAIDVGSRPFGKSIWAHKPAAVVSGSPGALGGFGANHHLRQSLVFLDMPTMQQPEAYIGHIGSFWENGTEKIGEATEQFLRSFMNAFGDWARLHHGFPAQENANA